MVKVIHLYPERGSRKPLPTRRFHAKYLAGAMQKRGGFTAQREEEGNPPPPSLFFSEGIIPHPSAGPAGGHPLPSYILRYP